MTTKGRKALPAISAPTPAAPSTGSDTLNEALFAHRRAPADEGRPAEETGPATDGPAALSEKADPPARKTTKRRGAPAAPAGYSSNRKALVVQLPGDDHYAFRLYAFNRNRDMQSLIAPIVAAFVAEPDAWFALFEKAESDGVSVGDLLNDVVRHVVSQPRR